MKQWPYLQVVLATLASLGPSELIQAKTAEKQCAIVFPMKGGPTLESGGLVTTPEAQPFLTSALSRPSLLTEASSAYVMAFFKTDVLDQPISDDAAKALFLRFIEKSSMDKPGSYQDAVHLLMQYIQNGSETGLGTHGGLKFRHVDNATVEVYMPPVSKPFLLPAVDALTSFLNIMNRDLNVELLNFRIQADWDLFNQTQWATNELMGKDCWVCRLSRIAVYRNQLKYTELPTAVYQRRERMPIFSISENRNGALKAWLMSSCSTEITLPQKSLSNAIKGVAAIAIVLITFAAIIYQRVKRYDEPNRRVI